MVVLTKTGLDHSYYALFNLIRNLEIFTFSNKIQSVSLSITVLSR